jgi:hypothetical protein
MPNNTVSYPRRTSSLGSTLTASDNVAAWYSGSAQFTTLSFDFHITSPSRCRLGSWHKMDHDHILKNKSSNITIFSYNMNSWHHTEYLTIHSKSTASIHLMLWAYHYISNTARMNYLKLPHIHIFEKLHRLSSL